MFHNSLSVIILVCYVALPTYRHSTYPAFRTAKLPSFTDVSVKFLSMPETPLYAPYTGVHTNKYGKDSHPLAITSYHILSCYARIFYLTKHPTFLKYTLFYIVCVFGNSVHKITALGTYWYL